MIVSYKILKELLPLGKSPEELVELFPLMMLSVESVEKRGDDTLFDLEITPNRPDLLGHLGVAAQLATFLNLPLPAPEFNLKGVEGFPEDVSVSVEDPRCGRYTAMVVEDVQVGPSPEWLRERIEALGLHSVNNVVDVSNYVMMLTGHPIHTFDLDLLEGSSVIVRPGRSGEKILCLDGVERLLSPDEIVIADRGRAVALAGVMGGEDSGIRPQTKRVMVESAYFVPKYIRYASRRLKVSTDSSYRFERGADYGVTPLAARWVASLLGEMGGKVYTTLKDVVPNSRSPLVVEVRPERVRRILGLEELDDPTIESMLGRLHLDTVEKKSHSVVVSVPSFRRDLEREIDIIEEIAILHGYDKIPERLPSVELPSVYFSEAEKVQTAWEENLRHYGFCEVVNYSFVGENECGWSFNAFQPLKIQNPLSLKYQWLRRSLLSSLLKSAQYNLNREQRGVKIYEKGEIYGLVNGEILEESVTALLMIGEEERRWNTGTAVSSPFLWMRGALESFLENRGGELELRPQTSVPLSDTCSWRIFLNGKPLGWIGEVKEEILAEAAVSAPAFYMEVSNPSLLGGVKPLAVSKVARHPSVWHDLSFLLEKRSNYGEIETFLKRGNYPFLESFYLMDLYEGDKIESGFRSLTIRFVFRAEERTLGSEEAAGVLESLQDALKSHFPIKFR